MSLRLTSTRRGVRGTSHRPIGHVVANGLVCLAVATLTTGIGCKRKTEADESTAPYVLTDQKSDIEEQNLRAVCHAAAQVLEEGAADRTTRLAELALPASADATLIDGLRATDPPKRMGVVRALIKKYGLAVECQPSLPAFEKGPSRPEELPPEAGTGQLGGQGGTPGSGGGAPPPDGSGGPGVIPAEPGPGAPTVVTPTAVVPSPTLATPSPEPAAPR